MTTVLRGLAALALCASPLAAQAETRWVNVVSIGDEVIAIDTATVTAVGDSVFRVWERTVVPETKEVRVLARADFDCRLRLTRVIAVVLPGFAPVPASDEQREWTEIVPGSVHEAQYRRVCS